MPDTGSDSRDFVKEAEELPLDAVCDAVDRLDESDEDWPELQWLVASRIHDRYQEDGEPADLVEALHRGFRSLEVMQRNGEPPAWVVADLALIVFDQWRCSSAADDYEQYVELLEWAIELDGGDLDITSVGAICRARLARALMSRDEVSDEERLRAISLWESAARNRGVDAEVRAGALTDLAAAHTGQGATAEDLRRAVELGRQASAEQVDDAEVAVDARLGLAYALDKLHEKDSEDEHLAEAITVIYDALALLGAGHVEYPGYAADLVDMLRRRGREISNPELMAEGLRLLRAEALPRTENGHHDRHIVLQAYAATASELGWTQDNQDLVREAIDMHRQAADLPDLETEQKVQGLINLASTLRDAADHFGDRSLLGEGVREVQRALELCPEPGPVRAEALRSAGNLFRDLFMAEGNRTDLDLAITMAKESLDLTPEDNANHAVRQTNLAVVLSDRYTERATIADLDEAIRLYRKALEAPEPVPRRIAERQNDLALALRDRYMTSYDDNDLTEALELAEMSVTNTAEESSAWPGYATNFANALIERYEVTENIGDLERAIQLFARALQRVVGRPADESGFATNLGLALAVQGDKSKSVERYNESISRLEQAVDVLPAHHPSLAHRLANLAEIHMQRSELKLHNGDLGGAKSDLLEAIVASRAAVDEAQERDGRALPALANLAGAMRHLRDLDPEAAELHEIADVQRRAAQLDLMTPIDRFPQTILWARSAQALGEGNVDEVMSAYRQAVELASEVAWIGLTVESRQTLLDQMAEALTDAVAYAVRTGHPWDALAWADCVRSVLWRQTVHARSIVDRGHAFESSPLRELVSVMSSHENRERRRGAAHRAADGFKLPAIDPAVYRELRFPGTLVLLIPGPESSSALLLDGEGGSTTIALPLATEHELEKQVAMLRDALLLLDENAPNAAGNTDTAVSHRIFDCLRWIWDAVAKPVLDATPADDSAQRRRIWWSSLGNFALLPIHAAGIYPRKRRQLELPNRGQFECLADHVLSAYLPTIAESSAREVSTPTRRLLYISTDADTDTLAHSDDEYTKVKELLSDTPMTELLHGDATVQAVQDALPHHPILHVTAHGVTRDGEAFASGFRLADGILTLGHLANSQVPHGRLATLLTCDSARGDVSLPNEALHVAGAVMQAGYPNIVAAAMPLRDSSAVPVAEAVYSVIERSDGHLGQLIIEALHDAVAKLRRDPTSALDPLAWAPLAYFGWGCEAVVAGFGGASATVATLGRVPD
ncbi:CHAT domain-containing protein [Gordonia sp. Z-3]|uniref:CHAT domain-containing protein n=1 Tax=Gordonia sp. Z-3 TaxID=3115408 RepID=UPI002E2CE2C2|nr:CHAT domain-containing protein [Gordonia sp. Z-3]MED5803055.1 CHAT domain-containing protein [Gordonia sp. Z-3]